MLFVWGGQLDSLQTKELGWTVSFTTYLATVKPHSKSACLRAFGKKTVWQRLVSGVISQNPQNRGKGKKAAYLSPSSPHATMSFLYPLEKTKSTGTFHKGCFCTATNWPREYFFFNHNSTRVAFCQFPNKERKSSLHLPFTMEGSVHLRIYTQLSRQQHLRAEVLIS